MYLQPIGMKTLFQRTFGSRTFALFAFFWVLFGATTCVNNLRDYNLQQMGVDALVRYHTFAVGHSRHPRLQPIGDVFAANGKRLPAKQPGQFAFGAIPYFFLNRAGITYEANYERAAALVTWLSAGLWAAIALALLDRMLRRFLEFSSVASFVGTLSVGAASTFLAYAGTAHHDVLAGSFLVIALYFFEASRANHARPSLWLTFAGGVFLGLTVFTSMLPALMVAAVGISALITRSWKAITGAIAGTLIGIAPLLIYNAHYFGKPWIPANVAGNYSDTLISPGWTWATSHLDAYLGNGGISLWKYAPAAALGIIGIFFLPRRLRRLRWTLIVALSLHLLYLLNIESMGTCSYGPRYLIPAILLLAPGVAALMDRKPAWAPQARLLIAGGLLAYGFLVNLVGALRGSMFCNLGEFAFWNRAGDIPRLEPGNSPLSGTVTILGIVLFAIWGVARLLDSRRSHAS